MKIPLFRPLVSDDAIKAVGDVLSSGWLTCGPQTEAFEKAFAQFVNTPYCIGVNTGTSAIHLGLRLLNLSPGSEVITSALTFVSVNHAILYERCKLVFADIQPDTGNLDIESVRKQITPKTGAIILLHYGGYPCDLDEFYKLSKKEGIPIVEDCAHACGAEYKDRKIGSLGHLQAFSFGPNKNLTMGDGGAITVQSLDHNVRLRRLRMVGIDKDAFQRKKGGLSVPQYQVVEVGYRYHLSDIHAAIGLAQLNRLAEENAVRRKIAASYCEKLADFDDVRLLDYKDDRQSSYHLFCILCNDRDLLIRKLRANGVEVGIHYMRNDRYPMFDEQELPNTEMFCNQVISLPMHLGLTDENLAYIAKLIREGW